MIKRAWLWALCLAASPLLSETIGDVEFNFPPSNYEWKLFLDSDSVEALFSSDESEETPDFTFEAEEGDESFELHAKIFTHREGEALELFTAAQLQVSDEGDEESEMQTLQMAQSQINQLLSQILPNHQFTLLSLSENETGGSFEWEMTDGEQTIFSGSTRGLLQRDNNILKMTLLSYFTTAIRTEHNRMVWDQVLQTAK